jgi:pyruvate-ferredoxin/flavodoxin oxidoreductase
VIVAMGSAVETVIETVDWLVARGEKVGVVAVRLFRPFHPGVHFAALPATRQGDRRARPHEGAGLAGRAAVPERRLRRWPRGDAAGARGCEPRVLGGRYGLGSKEFTPGHGAGRVRPPRPQAPAHFTVGINDDVTGTSLPYDADFDLEPADVRRCVFFGLGADGTVGANKNSIKIIGEQTNNFAQGYFVYDSKKSGSMTVSHLRFGPRPIRAPYLVSRRNSSPAASSASSAGRRPRLRGARRHRAPELPAFAGGDLGQAPARVAGALIDKKLRLFVIDATGVAQAAGMGGGARTRPADLLLRPVRRAAARRGRSRRSRRRSPRPTARRASRSCKMNFAAVDAALAGLQRGGDTRRTRRRAIARAAAYPGAPEFVQKVTARLLADQGDLMPVSAFPSTGAGRPGRRASRSATSRSRLRSGTRPCASSATSACSSARTPRSARSSSRPRPSPAPRGLRLDALQVDGVPRPALRPPGRPEDCTGCSLCVQVCPAKDRTNPRHKAIDMAAQPPRQEAERANWDFFLGLPDPDRTQPDT